MIRVGTLLGISFLLSSAVITPAEAQSFSEMKPIVVVEPLPGRDVVGELGGEWCAGFTPTDVPDKRTAAGSISRTMSSSIDQGFEDYRVALAMSVLCAHKDDPEFRKQAQYAVQLFVNQTGVTASVAIESMMARAHESTWKSEMTKGCSSIKPPDEAHRRDDRRTYAKRAIFGCGAGYGDKEFAWYYDRGTNPWTELDRLYYVLGCLPPMMKDEYDATEWTAVGLCGSDVQLLDVAKVDAETKSLPNALRIKAREQVAYAKALYGDVERSAKPKVDSDPDYKRLLYDVPQAAWKQWEADYEKHKQGVDEAFKFEDQLFGPSTTAYKDCYKPLMAATQAYVKASKIKSRKDFVEAMSQPIGYVLATSLGSCMAVTSPWSVGELLLKEVKPSREWRGPRVAVAFAMLDEFNRIKQDRTRFPVNPRALSPELFNQMIEEATEPPRTKITSSQDQLHDEAQGVVKAARKSKDNNQVLVADYKTETWMEPTSACESTGEIYKIWRGEVLYKQKCRNTGMAKRSFTPNTTAFYAPTAKGVRPGAFMTFAIPSASQHWPSRFGYPIAVYKTKNQKVLTNIFGFTP